MVAHTVGGVVTPGSPILDIVPKNDKLMIEAQVRPADIDSVKSGLLADVRFPAFNNTDIPQLIGSVVRVSADRSPTPAARPTFSFASRSANSSSPGWEG